MSDDKTLETRLAAARTAGALETPPESTLTRARALFRLHYPAQESGAVRLARLVLDSLRGPQALAPARGGALPEARELLYESGDLTIRVFQEPDPEGVWYLIVHLLSPEGQPLEGIDATLEPGTLRAEEVGRGELHWEGVAAGRYHLRLHLPEGVSLVVPEVPVGAG